jgi:hypothetical protein
MIWTRRIPVYKISETDAWAMAEEMRKDTEGGHSLFPLLNLNGALAEKLYRFLDEIV